MIKMEKPWYDRCVIGFGASLGLALLSCVLACWQIGFVLLAMVFVASGMVSYMGIWLAAKRLPKAVEFGNLKTFRDLAELIAKQNAK